MNRLSFTVLEGGRPHHEGPAFVADTRPPLSPAHGLAIVAVCCVLAWSAIGATAWWWWGRS